MNTGTRNNVARTFQQTIEACSFMLMEAAVIERLRRARPELLHPRLVIAPLVETEKGRNALATLYREYIGVAQQAALPIILNTPTWRASKDRCSEEQVQVDLNGNAVQFMLQFKQDYSALFIAGQLGCKNDCYTPEQALSTAEAAEFHAWQIERLLGADFLYGVTLPEIGEALGMAQSMAATPLPYIISFVLGKEGHLLDGTPLEKAIERIDTETARPPLGYGANCCYPTFFQPLKLSTRARQRMISIQANASSLTHTELEQAETVQADPINHWVAAMLEHHKTHGLKILGGCCGTNAAYLNHLAGLRV